MRMVNTNAVCTRSHPNGQVNNTKNTGGCAVFDMEDSQLIIVLYLATVRLNE